MKTYIITSLCILAEQSLAMEQTAQPTAATPHVLVEAVQHSAPVEYDVVHEFRQETTHFSQLIINETITDKAQEIILKIDNALIRLVDFIEHIKDSNAISDIENILITLNDTIDRIKTDDVLQHSIQKIREHAKIIEQRLNENFNESREDFKRAIERLKTQLKRLESHPDVKNIHRELKNLEKTAQETGKALEKAGRDIRNVFKKLRF